MGLRSVFLLSCAAVFIFGFWAGSAYQARQRPAKVSEALPINHLEVMEEVSALARQGRCWSFDVDDESDGLEIHGSMRITENGPELRIAPVVLFDLLVRRKNSDEVFAFSAYEKNLRRISESENFGSIVSSDYYFNFDVSAHPYLRAQFKNIQVRLPKKGSSDFYLVFGPNDPRPGVPEDPYFVMLGSATPTGSSRNPASQCPWHEFTSVVDGSKFIPSHAGLKPESEL